MPPALKPGTPQNIAMMRDMTEFTGVHRLNNLIWVLGWAGQNVDPAWYPGRATVDVAGADIYANDHGNPAPMFAQLKAIVGETLPICLHENGPASDPALLGPSRTRRIEFIGDSHTVGYGNVSIKRDCTQDEVWTTTDASQAIPALTARRYGADYRSNAISGGGILRNYDGMAADTVPMAYPFTLFDKATRYADPAWRPRLFVVALGLNDFTTSLHPA